MSRSIYSSSSSGLASTSSKLKAGAPFVTNDVVQMMSNGQAAPVRTSDYGVVANAGTAILAATTATSNAVTQSYSGSLAVQGPDGSLYFLKSATLDKYSVAGTLIQSYSIATLPTLNNIFFLTNGNLCITGVDNSSNAYYLIFNPVGMVLVVAPTLMTTSTGNAKNLATIPLVGGGFAAFYNGASTTSATLAIYNNAGVLQSSATVTTTSSSIMPLLNLTQLSNGNIAVAYLNTNYFVAIYNLSAVIQVAPFTTGWPMAQGTYNVSCPYFSVMTGFFAISPYPGYCMIFSNAGSQQGASFIGTPVALAYPAYTNSVVNDGTNFWFVYITPTSVNYVSITTAGATVSYSFPATFGATAGQWSYFDSATGNIVTWFGATAYCVFSPALASLITPLTNLGTSLSSNDYYSATAMASQTGLVMLGDGAFLCYGGNASGVAFISIWKSINTAIIGIATGSAVVGALVSLFSQSGVYYANTIKGSGSKTFDHSTANIYGNKGSLTNNSVVLRGM